MFHTDAYTEIDKHQKYMHRYTHVFTQSTYMLLYLNCCYRFLYLSYQNTIWCTGILQLW